MSASPKACAAREYVADEQWQAVVLKWVNESQAVVLQPSQSGGMRWELETVFKLMPRQQILIVFAHDSGTCDDYEDLKQLLEPLLRTPLPRSLPYRGMPVALWFEQDGTVRWTEFSYRSPASWLFFGDAVDIEYTLRPFVQGLHGGERELPRPCRTFAWYQYACAWLLVGLWMFAFGLWLDQDRINQGISPRSNVPAFVDSNSRTVVGTAFPYRVNIPESWIERIVSTPGIEHEFAKPGIGLIRIVVDPSQEDLGNLPERLVASAKEQMGAQGRDAIAEAVERMTIGDRSCVKIKVRNEFRNGATDTSASSPIQVATAHFSSTS